MTVLHQEVGAVLFGRDGIGIGLRDPLHDLDIRYIEFVSARGALVRADFTLNDHARFLGKTLDRIEDFLRNGFQRHSAHRDPRAFPTRRSPTPPSGGSSDSAPSA